MQDSKSPKCRCSTREACQGFILTEEQLCDLSNRLLKSMLKGLSKEGHETAAVRCYQTFVQDFPTGNETGVYMALDLGGTNFRVLSVELFGKEKPPKMNKETYELPQALKIGKGEELFDYVANSIIDFYTKHAKDKVNSTDGIPLGFTFSFPVTQNSLHAGTLIKWTKGFEASGVIGNNVVQMLEDAFKRKNLENRFSPIIILNDTTGTLMSCAMHYPDVRVGLIIGTGSNACYTEKIENIKNFRGDPSKPYMVINAELGNFGADGMIDDFLTEYDRTLIGTSSHKQNQTFEKCVSGRYLGEIMRLVLLRLIREKVLFGGFPGKLETPYVFRSEFLTKIESDAEMGPFKNAIEALKEMGIDNYDDQDIMDLRFVSAVISTRSACFVAAATSTFLNKMEFSPVTVGVDGTVYRQHPRYKKVMEDVTRCLVKPEIQFKYILSEDGSGRGAAFTVAVTGSSKKKYE